MAGPPTIESESVSDLTATSATLHATIDPTGVATSYFFELCHDSACTNVPHLPAAPSVAAKRRRRQPAGHGTECQHDLHLPGGRDLRRRRGLRLRRRSEFTTTTEGKNVELPDGRAWELVSSPEKSGAGLETIPREGGLIESSVSGSSLTYISLAPFSSQGKEIEGNRVPSFVQLLAKREASQWGTEDIALPGENATGAITGNGKQEYRDFSPDLELSLVEPLGLSPKAEPRFPSAASERTVYTRKTQDCEAPPFELLHAARQRQQRRRGRKIRGSGRTQAWCRIRKRDA